MVRATRPAQSTVDKMGLLLAMLREKTIKPVPDSTSFFKPKNLKTVVMKKKYAYFIKWITVLATEQELAIKEARESATRTGGDSDELEIPLPLITGMTGMSIKGVLYEKVLGEGLFGVVYKGKKDELDIAIKVLDLKSTPENTITCEIEIMRLLETTEGVLRLIGYDTLMDYHFIYLSLAQSNLYDFLQLNKKKRFREETVRKIIYQGLTTLKAIHQKRIIHRDIKTDNFMVTIPQTDDHLVTLLLGDFGLARSLDADPIPHDFSRHFHSTPNMEAGGEPTMVDDLIQFGYSLLDMNGKDLNNMPSRALSRLKTQLNSSPKTVLTSHLKFLLPLFEELSLLDHDTAIDYNMLKEKVPLVESTDLQLKLTKVEDSFRLL
uniref:Protein kinase domain-containing protein n=1 Tax=Caenorhabditis tropicalis TaxID=1561998 RepID=A0A1I7U1X8_9PELO